MGLLSYESLEFGEDSDYCSIVVPMQNKEDKNNHLDLRPTLQEVALVFIHISLRLYPTPGERKINLKKLKAKVTIGEVIFSLTEDFILHNYLASFLQKRSITSYSDLSIMSLLSSFLPIFMLR